MVTIVNSLCMSARSRTRSMCFIAPSAAAASAKRPGDRILECLEGVRRNPPRRGFNRSRQTPGVLRLFRTPGRSESSSLPRRTPATTGDRTRSGPSTGRRSQLRLRRRLERQRLAADRLGAPREARLSQRGRLASGRATNRTSAVLHAGSPAEVAAPMSACIASPKIVVVLQRFEDRLPASVPVRSLHTARSAQRQNLTHPPGSRADALGRALLDPVALPRGGKRFRRHEHDLTAAATEEHAAGAGP